MSDQQPKQTPILDLLRDIPADAHMVYEVNPTHHQSIPVGVLAHQAADEVDRLRAERDDNAWWRKELADKLHDRETQISNDTRVMADQSRQIERLRAELRIIADADPSKWEPDVRGEFREWAQNRARAAIAQADAAMGASNE